MPRPRKLKLASAMMRDPIPKVAATMIGAAEFGTRCVKIIRALEAPSARDASVNSRAFRERTDP